MDNFHVILNDKFPAVLPDVVDLEDGWRPLAELGVEHGTELVGGGDQNQLHYRGSYRTHVGGPQVNPGSWN
jgi:hypothetical protein